MAKKKVSGKQSSVTGAAIASQLQDYSRTLSVDEVIKETDRIIAEAEYDLLRAKSPRKQRILSIVVQLWKSIRIHLSGKEGSNG